MDNKTIAGIVCIVIGLLLVNQYHFLFMYNLGLAKKGFFIGNYNYFGQVFNPAFIEDLCLYLIYCFIILGLILLVKREK